jgi:hypothetical protein
MKLKALSVVHPWGDLITSGRKTLEIRSWRPDELPIENLLIVQNTRRLTLPGETDPDGQAVALVTVRNVRPWAPDETEAAGTESYESGLLAWELENVRALPRRFRALAARRIYELDVDEDLVELG